MAAIGAPPLTVTGLGLDEGCLSDRQMREIARRVSPSFPSMMHAFWC